MKEILSRLKCSEIDVLEMWQCLEEPWTGLKFVTQDLASGRRPDLFLLRRIPLPHGLEIRKQAQALPHKRPLEAATALGPHGDLRHFRQDKSAGGKALLCVSR